ncbi:MAG: glycosyltransferase [Clostridia bacterium]|nr:glycosyltransferase [Clostridia bacterium]
MKVLLINKFLYPKGGAETYVFKLGEALTAHGHQVEYFGLENEKNIVGNRVGSYVSHMDFNEGVSKNLTAPFRMIYSSEARKKIKKVLYDFQPDVVNMNNIQFHLTPSMILEIEKYRKKTGRKVKIVYTAHDYQLICPSHGLFDADIRICEKCLGGNYTHCLRTKCVKNSRAKSFLGMMDAYWWKISKAYSCIDVIICPSQFLKEKLDLQKRFADKTVTLHNFIEPQEVTQVEKGDYVLEFGHLSRDKGTNTLLEVAKRMPNVRFLFAGYGKAEEDIAKVENAEYVGFKTGEELKDLIRKARVSVYPSEWYENCPFSVIESQMYLTPVIGSRMGGIPELIQEGKTGLMFEAGNADDLEAKLRFLLETPGKLEEFTENCKHCTFETPDTYYEKLMKIYGEE